MVGSDDQPSGEEPVDDQKTQETHWSEGNHENERSQIPLELKDYVAIFIASLETIFLPLVIVTVFMVLLAMAITLLT